MKKKLLITGATGMLGATLAQYFKDRYDVFATGSSNPNLDFLSSFMEFNLADLDYSQLIYWAKPDIIIHGAALTNGNYCEQNPTEALDINGISLQRICNAIPDSTHLIYISTDAVFSNDKHLANETDCVNPESVYGKSKELGEFFLRNSKSNYTVVRTTIVGTNLNPIRKGFVEWIINSAKNKSEISLFDDVLFTPISIWNLADQLKYIIENCDEFSRETLHIAGSEICTKYQFGITLLKTLNLPTETIKRGKIADFVDRAKRSTDQTLNSKKFEQMSKRALPDLKQTVEDIKKNYNEKH